MGTTILFIWAVVAASGDRHGGSQYYEWRVLSEFSSRAHCERAIEVLGVDKTKARCVVK